MELRELIEKFAQRISVEDYEIVEHKKHFELIVKETKENKRYYFDSPNMAADYISELKTFSFEAIIMGCINYYTFINESCEVRFGFGKAKLLQCIESGAI